ncbi:MAG: archease [Thermoproteota archaeon]|nr:archease [Thermoproteota archaeon]
MKKRFELLEHTADAYIAAYGASLEEAFENAALATSEVMTDTRKVKPKVEEQVEVKAKDEYALLYNWLEEIIVKFDIQNRLYSRFKISTIKPTSNGFKLKAKIWGEPFDPERHPQKVGVKAVTYHRMAIIKKPNMVTVEFILDI